MTAASIVAGKVAALRASGNAEVRTVKPDVTVAEAIRRMRDELVGALASPRTGRASSASSQTAGSWMRLPITASTC
jgi:hypothetical protein